MPLSEDEKNGVKEMVLGELDKMFTEVTNKYNTEENHDMMQYLLDVESRIKNALTESDL